MYYVIALLGITVALVALYLYISLPVTIGGYVPWKHRTFISMQKMFISVGFRIKTSRKERKEGGVIR